MGKDPVICFGQQPCGFFPRRFLFAKMQTARRVQKEVGGRIVFFYHDSDHDPRETQTIMTDKVTGKEKRLNFSFVNRVQKKYSPLYAKKVDPVWQKEMTRKLPQYISEPMLVDTFKNVHADNIADFCLNMYEGMGLLEGMEVVRSSDTDVREAACLVDDYYVDVSYENEIVRARVGTEKELYLHKGGDEYILLARQSWKHSQISPTRDTRLRWMQSVIQCTHYVAGAGEMKYLDKSEAPSIKFICRGDISSANEAYVL